MCLGVAMGRSPARTGDRPVVVDVKRASRGRHTNMHRASDASTPGHGTPSAASPQRGASPSSSTPSTNGGSGSSFEAETGGHVCPVCGLAHEISEDFDATAPCPRCTLADTPTTRNATKARVGPWHVRQMRNPWAPGMRWETLLALIKRGQVTKDSVVRGPTTHQLWKRASEVKGLSREFGVCYSCGGEVDSQANLCGHCNRLQEPPVNPNVLVETREFANGGGPAESQPEQPPQPAPAPSAKATVTAAGVRPNGKGPRRSADDDAPAHFDMGATTPAGADPDDMLTVDDPEQAAAMARAITSRAPRSK